MKPTALFTALVALLVAAHLLAIAGSVIAAAVNIESIVITGLPCSLLGLAVGVFGIGARNPWLALLGFSTGVCSLAVFAWIVALSWSPQEAHAHAPVTAALLGYETSAAVLGAMGLYQLLSGEERRAQWGQFHVRSLLLLMLLMGIDLAIVRAALQLRMPVLVVMAIGAGVAAIIGAGLAVHLGRRQMLAARPSLPT